MTKVKPYNKKTYNTESSLNLRYIERKMKEAMPGESQVYPRINAVLKGAVDRSPAFVGKMQEIIMNDAKRVCDYLEGIKTKMQEVPA